MSDRLRTPVKLSEKQLRALGFWGADLYGFRMLVCTQNIYFVVNSRLDLVSFGTREQFKKDHEMIASLEGFNQIRKAMGFIEKHSAE